LDFDNAGSSSDASMAMMAITTSSSISVKASFRRAAFLRAWRFFCALASASAVRFAAG
jgi:hypothetical protein